jgi:hypothetical protein
VSEAERCAQLICWVLPGFVAGWLWGVPVALITFGGQMLIAPRLVRLYSHYNLGRGGVTTEVVRRFSLLAHIMTGVIVAGIAEWAERSGYIV